MKRCFIAAAALGLIGWFLLDMGFAQRHGGGGRGGGGGGGGGGGRAGGGGFRSGAPSGGLSGAGRPSSGMSRSASPSGSRGPTFSGPAGAGRRSAGGAGRQAVAGGAGRQAITGDTRPGGGRGAGAAAGKITRPGGAAPDAGTRPRPGVGAPGKGEPLVGVPGRGLPGKGEPLVGVPGKGVAGKGAPGKGEPLIGVRPRAPGRGARPDVGIAAPGRGERPGRPQGPGERGRPSRLADRGGSIQDRRRDLERDLADRHDNIRHGREHRKDWRDHNREHWHDWWDHHHEHHGWHDHWHAAWYPGAWWAVASWAAPWWGYWWYDNPYVGADTVVYNYSEPIIVYEVPAEIAQAAPATAARPGVTPDGMLSFDAAREAFADRDYKQALEQMDLAVKAMPNDVVAHEFRALVLFALQDYRQAAAVAYAVLSAGPGWDWTTLSGLYADTAEYERQLRALEDYAGKHPKSADGHFLLAYHYMTTGYADYAARQLKQVLKIQPDDKLASDLLKLVTPQEIEPAPTQPATPAKATAGDELVGSWTARGTGASRFHLTLDDDGTFVWTYQRDKQTQEMRGVYAVDQGVLALEPDAGGILLADVALDGGKLNFRMAGGDSTDPALEFVK